MRSVGILQVAAGLCIATSALADVSPDCFAEEMREVSLCAQNRIEDAEAADRLLAPVIARHGWSRGCYELQYVAGDNGGPDTLLISIHGARGGSAPACRSIRAVALSAGEVRQIQDRGGTFDDAVKATARKSLRRGRATAATEDEVRSIGRDIKRALLTSTAAVRARLLRHTRQISLGNGYGVEVEVTL